MPSDLPAKYYLDHARELFAFVQDDCQHLLLAPHQHYLETFATLDEDAQCLLVRFLARKPRFIKTSSLSYSEITNISESIRSLVDHQLIEPLSPDDWTELVPHLTKPQLIVLLRDAQCTIKQSTAKAELVALARAHIPAQSRSLRPIFDEYLKRCQNDTIDYLFFLFFGNLRPQFQKFAMRDLGVLKTRRSNNQRVARFGSLEEALSAFTWQRQRREFNANPQQVAAQTANYLLDNDAIGPGAQETRHGLLLDVGNALIDQDRATAITLWRTADSSEATERWVRETYKTDRESLQYELQSMQETEMPAKTRIFIEDFYARKYLGKRTSVYTDLLRESASTLLIDEAYVNQVETGVVDHYTRQKYTVFFTENTVWRVLFAFTFWDLLFGKNEVQHSEFDHLPPLLRSGRFYTEFNEAIEKRLQSLDAPAKLITEFTRVATQQFGKPTGLFQWNANLLDAIIPCLLHSPKGAIAAVLRRMAQDYRHTKDGYPDLMVIRDKQLRFEEIKAPGDVLRPNQLVSIQRLRRAGFQVDVTQVEWTINPEQIYSVVDIETTGTMKGANAITEIAVVRVQNGQVISEWSTLINPQRPIPAHITRLTGIDNAMVADAPVFSDIADSLSKQLDDCIFVAHNVGFDYGFIRAAYASIGQEFRKPKYCTVRNARKAFPGLKSYSLGALTDHFDIDLNGAHRALNDARATADLLRLIHEETQTSRA